MVPLRVVLLIIKDVIHMALIYMFMFSMVETGINWRDVSI